MRLQIQINARKQLIPYDHQSQMVGTIHKWLGWNNEHGQLSLYSFSRLTNATNTKNGLKIEDKTSFFFSAYDPDIAKRLIEGIRNNPQLFQGLKVTDILIQEDPDLREKEYFLVSSPVLIKKRDGEKTDHLLYKDPQCNFYLKQALLTKMNKVGLNDDSLLIQFDTEYRHAQTMKISYNGIENRVNWCPVIIKGKTETKLFAWNVGLGNSTGIGFGAIK